jgi:hypothetical protein
MIHTKSAINEIQENDKKNHQEVVAAFTEQNFNLNLCKTFLLKLIQSHLTPIELKRNIKEFLNSINDK